MRLSLILPTLNERENLTVLIPELWATVPVLTEILVVDDGSTDGTRELVRELARSEPRLRLFERVTLPGLTASLQDGILAANGDLIGWMDADLAMSPADLRRLVAAVEAGAEVAVGSRFAVGGSIKGQAHGGVLGKLGALRNVQNSEDSWIGVALSWALNAALLPALMGDGVHDYTSGFVVMRAEVARELRLRGGHGEYFISLMADLERQGRRVVDVPYRIGARRYGRSKTANSLRDWRQRGARYLGAAARARLGR